MLRSGVKFRGHDLRRTAASLMVGGGVPRYVPEKRAALDYWGNRLEQVVTADQPARVLMFAR